MGVRGELGNWVLHLFICECLGSKGKKNPEGETIFICVKGRQTDSPEGFIPQGSKVGEDVFCVKSTNKAVVLYHGQGAGRNRHWAQTGAGSPLCPGLSIGPGPSALWIPRSW